MTSPGIGDHASPPVHLEIGTLALRGLAHGTHDAVLRAMRGELARLAAEAHTELASLRLDRIEAGRIPAGLTPDAAGRAIAAAVMRQIVAAQGVR